MAKDAGQQDTAEHIGVILRLRPLSRAEVKAGAHKAVRRHGEHALLITRPGSAPALFRCDLAFDETCSQLAFFERCGIVPLLESTLAGFRATVFAYGQTGAGKTFTMLGDGGAFGSAPAHSGSMLPVRQERPSGSQEGVLPRAMRYLYMRMAELGTVRKFRARVTCIEIYREVVSDLLVELPSKRAPLHVREHPKLGFFVEGLRVAQCASAEKCSQLVAKALSSRKVGAHKLNERSSRSHCIITVYIDAEPVVVLRGNNHDNGGDERGVSSARSARPTYGSVSFVDLAGSERPKQTGSDGAMLRDAGHINKSLYNLGKVIRGLEQLARGGGSTRGPRGGGGGDRNRAATSHTAVPFRESQLTKLLISSLGGHCKCVMLGCCSTASGEAVRETLRTLDFAGRVRGIKNLPQVQTDPHKNIIDRLNDEIERLRRENAHLRQRLSTAPAALRDGPRGAKAKDRDDGLFPAWQSRKTAHAHAHNARGGGPRRDDADDDPENEFQTAARARANDDAADDDDDDDDARRIPRSDGDRRPNNSDTAAGFFEGTAEPLRRRSSAAAAAASSSIFPAALPAAARARRDYEPEDSQHLYERGHDDALPPLPRDHAPPRRPLRSPTRELLGSVSLPNARERQVERATERRAPRRRPPPKRKKQRSYDANDKQEADAEDQAQEDELTAILARAMAGVGG